MKTKLYFLWIVLLGFGVNAQNTSSLQPSEQNPNTVIDQDIPSRQVINDDLEVIGSLGIGNGTPANQFYGFDTMILTENNLRILFRDDSNTGSFPTNDWRITINDSQNGGASFFGVDDVDAGTNPFRISAGSPSNALFISGSGGNVGLGTNNPVVELQVTDGDSPAMRLEQNNSSGFTPQTWDVAGNETNFFIRDVTNASALPFRIRPGAANSAIDIGADASVSINGAYSNPNISINLAANNRGMLLNRMDNTGRTTLGGLLSPTETGTLVYDTDDLLAYLWDGITWTPAGSDDQALTLNINSLDLEDGGSVDLTPYLDNTDDQALTLNVNSLDLEDGGSVDLTPYLDNTDDQNILGSGFAGNILTIGIEGGTSEAVDLSALDNTGTDDQQLTLAGNSLNLEDGGSVDLSGYLDNTDNQNLSNFILSGPLLSIAITGGNSITVNLSPLLQDLEDENAAQQAQIDAILAVNAAQQAQIDDLIARMIIQEECECTGPLGVGDFEAPNDKALLMQNVPNPYDNITSIGYFIPLIYSKANIVISATTGQILENRKINKFGEGVINVNKDRMSAGIYYYTLYVDGMKVDTKRMIVE